MDSSRRNFIKTSSIGVISILPGISALSKILGSEPSQSLLLIDCGFRLTNWKNLLNLEFYFINVRYQDNCILRKRKILSNYGQEESYMIVRLPQQHIAEQSYSVPLGQISPESDWTAVTMISGYSYLVFRIMFNANESRHKIPLTSEALMDWNNEKNDFFKLVVRQNLTESLFEITTKEKLYQVDNNGAFILLDTDGNRILEEKDDKENKYPFGYDKQTNGNYKYNYSRFPKAYGDPITALEFPWRLILSPKLPDQDRFKWNWEFSNEPKELNGKIEAELWTACLTLKENPEYFKLLELKKKYQTKEKKENSQKKDVEEIIKKIELMILGSPDYPVEDYKSDEIFTKNPNWKILPRAADRRKLVELYIRYKLIARSDKLIFSPVGVSTFLELKNIKIQETSEADTKNNLFSWKQLISFGRDEEVEIIELFVDKEFGHKWLHIFTTKRRTKKGLSYLDYREYIMPLEVEKDYAEHLNEKLKDINDSTEYSTSKFNAPFKSIKLLDIKPKRIQPLNTTNYNTSTGNGRIVEAVEFATNVFAYIPKAFDNNQDGTPDFVEFQYLATDWQNQTIVFRKKIQAVQFAAFDFINKTKITIADRNTELKKIETLFSSDKTDELEKKIRAYSNKYKDIVQSLSQIETPIFKPVDQLNRYKNLITSTKIYNSLNKELSLINDALVSYLEDFNSTLEVYKEEISRYKTLLKSKSDAIVAFVRAKTDTIDITEAAFETLLNDLESQVNSIAEQELSSIKKSLTDKFNELSFGDIRSSVKIKIDGVEDEVRKIVKQKVFDEWNKIYQAEKTIPNLIRTYRQKIGYAIEDFKTQEQKALDGFRDEVSNLETDYLVFKGELKREFETSTLEFFNQYASVPQLKQAKAYVKSLNKLVNEEIPIGVRYAKDYLDNQIDLVKLEVEQNASRVFLEVTESSQEYLKGKIRQVASDMGGYLNPEIPVEFLTYLKDPKKVPDKLKEELLNQYPELNQYAKEIQNGYNDLVFISGEAKKQWNDTKQIQPDAFFKGLEAKILGSISLKDILGLDFEIPRLSELPDKMVYNFQTDKIEDKEFSIVKFYAKNKGKHAALQVYLEKKIKNPNEYKSFTRLSNFSIAIRLASEDVLLILFNKLEVSSSNTESKKTQVKIDDVSFGGPLNFLGKLAEAIKIPGSGLRVQPSFTKVEIGYTFALPSIETPAFNLANLKFDIGLIIPFPTSDAVRPISTTFSINRPDDKFLVTVGIFGGRGHFVMEATPQKIIGIDASIEFGGYLGINLGIASGQVYLFAGIRYQCYGGDITFTGYLICGGGVTVFGFISVSVTFLLAMVYQNVGGQATLYGSASVSYCIKIAFFKKSFTLSYSKRIAGAKGKTVDPNSDGSTAYIDHTEEPVYYASTSNELMLLPSNSDVDTNQVNEIPVNDIKSFKTIYPKNSGLWEQYCNSFNF